MRWRTATRRLEHGRKTIYDEIRGRYPGLDILGNPVAGSSVAIGKIPVYLLCAP